MLIESEAPRWFFYAIPATRECGAMEIPDYYARRHVEGGVLLADLPLVGETSCGAARDLVTSQRTDDACADLRDALRNSELSEPPTEMTRAAVCLAFGMDGGPVRVTEEKCYRDELWVRQWTRVEECGEGGFENARLLWFAELLAGVVAIAGLALLYRAVTRRRRRVMT